MGACGFKDANIVIERGEKVAFVGKNGEGSRP
jgi:ABC-type polysaccharide/polyol phosphate transport system ATPase subunit